MAERRKFTKEFKLEVVRSIIEGGKSLKQVSLELAIRQNLLQRWVAEYRGDPDNAFPGSGQLRPDDDELRRRKYEIDTVTRSFALRQPETGESLRETA